MKTQLKKIIDVLAAIKSRINVEAYQKVDADGQLSPADLNRLDDIVSRLRDILAPAPSYSVDPDVWLPSPHSHSRGPLPLL